MYTDGKVTNSYFVALISAKEQQEIRNLDWKDTQVLLPPNVPLRWEHMLTKMLGQKDVINEGILVSQLFDDLPIALLNFTFKENDR